MLMGTLRLPCLDLSVAAKITQSNAQSSRRPADTRTRIVRLERCSWLRLEKNGWTGLLCYSWSEREVD
jgi:hypothetical protein